jgi:hypothetical protein
MRTLSLLSAMASVAVLPYACATPVEIADDVQIVDSFDGGVVAGASSAGSAGSAGTPGGSGASGAAGGSGSANAGSANNGGSANGGSANGGSTNNGGSANGGSAQSGSGGASGAAGNTAMGGTTALGGTGGVDAAGGVGGDGTDPPEPVFDPDACDLSDRGGCEDLACEVLCPAQQCGTRCTDIVTCIEANPGCSTEADPTCGIRIGPMSTPNVCTSVVEPGGGANAPADQPAGVVRELMECVCSVPRPE